MTILNLAYYGKFFVDNFEKKIFLKKTIFDVIRTSKSADFGRFCQILAIFIYNINIRLFGRIDKIFGRIPNSAKSAEYRPNTE